MTLPIIDGGPVNTEPELEFPPDLGRPLSPAEQLDNLWSWLHSALKADVFAAGTATELEANMIRRDAFLDVMRWMRRLGAEEWV